MKEEMHKIIQRVNLDQHAKSIFKTGSDQAKVRSMALIVMCVSYCLAHFASRTSKQ